MMGLNINELNITNVSHQKLSEYLNEFDIAFEIDGVPYRLYAVGATKPVRPIHIEHLDEDSLCTYCKKPSDFCEKLAENKKELFHRLIEQPSIRLEWLYINHV